MRMTAMKAKKATSCNAVARSRYMSTFKIKYAIPSTEISGQRISERGTVIEFMGGEQVYIVVKEQPEDIIKPEGQHLVEGDSDPIARDH